MSMARFSLAVHGPLLYKVSNAVTKAAAVDAETAGEMPLTEQTLRLSSFERRMLALAVTKLAIYMFSF